MDTFLIRVLSSDEILSNNHEFINVSDCGLLNTYEECF
jgi:hypothetical protein